MRVLDDNSSYELLVNLKAWLGDKLGTTKVLTQSLNTYYVGNGEWVIPNVEVVTGDLVAFKNGTNMLRSPITILKFPSVVSVTSGSTSTNGDVYHYTVTNNFKGVDAHIGVMHVYVTVIDAKHSDLHILLKDENGSAWTGYATFGSGITVYKVGGTSIGTRKQWVTSFIRNLPDRNIAARSALELNIQAGEFARKNAWGAYNPRTPGIKHVFNIECPPSFQLRNYSGSVSMTVGVLLGGYTQQDIDNRIVDNSNPEWYCAWEAFTITFDGHNIKLVGRDEYIDLTQFFNDTSATALYLFNPQAIPLTVLLDYMEIVEVYV